MTVAATTKDGVTVFSITNVSVDEIMDIAAAVGALSVTTRKRLDASSRETNPPPGYVDFLENKLQRLSQLQLAFDADSVREEVPA